MRTITAQSIDGVYLRLSNLFATKAKRRRGSKGEDIYSVGAVAINIENPANIGLMSPARDLSFRYAAGETSLLLRETDDVNRYARYSTMWNRLALNGKVNSAYGKRIAEKWEFAKAQLLKNIESKNAIIDMRRDTDSDPLYARDFCCTLALKFSGDEDTHTLSMTAVMRSSDAWLGLPYDAVMWSLVLSRMAWHVNCKVGRLTLVLLDSHVYQRHRERLLEVRNLPTCKSATLPYWDGKCEQRLADYLAWEDEVSQHKIDEPCMVDYAQKLYDMKLPRTLETLGAWICSKHTKSLPDTIDATILRRTYLSPLRSACVDRRVVCTLMDDEGNTQQAVNTVIDCNKMCDDKQNRVCNVTHAERMALAQWNYPTKPTNAYVTLAPCANCRRALEEAGVKTIVTYLPLHKASSGTAELVLVGECPND